MKTKIKLSMVLFVFLVLQGNTLRAQWTVYDPGNFAQGIINTTNQIAQTSATAQGVMHNFVELQRIYYQGKEYYDKLRMVNNLVRDARKVQQTVLLVSEITQMYITSFGKMMNDPNFTTMEIVAIAAGYALLLQESTELLRELKQIISPTSLSFNDKERIDIVDRVYSEVRRYHSLVSYYTKKNISVSVIRSIKKSQSKQVFALYGNFNEKYW